MTSSQPEAGWVFLAPVASWAAGVGYASIASWVATIGLTGWQLYDIFGDEDPGEALEAEQTSQALQGCQAELDQGGGLTPGARTYYRDELKGWKARARSELAGNQVAIATVDKTVATLSELYSQEKDGEGQLVSLCHVYAGSQILERQLAALANKQPGEIPPLAEQGPPPARAARIPWPLILTVAGLGALAFFVWSKP